jgi:hypothetical protein
MVNLIANAESNSMGGDRGDIDAKELAEGRARQDTAAKPLTSADVKCT